MPSPQAMSWGTARLIQKLDVALLSAGEAHVRTDGQILCDGLVLRSILGNALSFDM